MISTNRQILAACERPTVLVALCEALSARGLAARASSFGHAMTSLEAVPCEALVVVPALAPPAGVDAWTSVAEELTRTFELLQRFARRAIANKSAGHAIVLLPSAAAMGDPSDSAGSALAGGMLSLVRTLALEFRKLGMTANAVLFERAEDTLGHDADLAALVELLVAQPGTAISGQTIYACNASDAGRLHP